MLVKVYNVTDRPLKVHLNPYSVVDAYWHRGSYYIDTTDGTLHEVDRESYNRIVAWMEQAR